MFLNADLQFDHQIHTVGITHNRPLETAPSDCFIVHFDSMIKSTDEQIAKVRRYEDLDEGSAWTYSDMYLPHLYAEENFIFHNRGIGDFMPLLDKLDVPQPGRIALTRRERKHAGRYCPSTLRANPTGIFRRLFSS